MAKIAVSHEARFVLDASGPSLARALETGDVYLAKPNLRELSELVGRELPEDTDVEKAARGVLEESRCRVLVVSLAARGAFVATADDHFWINAPQVPLQSRVGAGDSMVGAMVLCLARGMPLADAARFGVAAGTAASMNPGTTLCRRSDAEALFDAMSRSSG